MGREVCYLSRAMSCTRTACLWAAFILLCACQPAFAKPSAEPEPPAESPQDPEAKPGQGDADKAKDGEAPGKEAPDGKDDGGKPGGPEAKGDEGKDSKGKDPEGKGDDGASKDGKGEAGDPEPAEPEPTPPAKPPVVEHTEPEFIGDGEVPKVTTYLAKTLKSVGQCVADHGGLDQAKGELEIQFLVRARGRAEGVEVLSSKAVSADAGRCVRKLLKNRWVGTPTHDPVGVTFHYRLKRAR